MIMTVLIAWCGFVGAWFLVAGPIYQAAIELGETEFDRDAIHDLSNKVPVPPRISPWWWLFPPLGYFKQRRRSTEYREAVTKVLKPEHLAQFTAFRNKATGWIFVAAGAFFIAVKETWEVVEIYEWPLGVFIAVVVVMVISCAVNTTLRMRASHGALGEDDGRRRRADRGAAT